MKWFVKCIRNYANFWGRARRKEYWYFKLSQLLVVCVAVGIAFAGFPSLSMPGGLVILMLLYVPSLAVTVRRLHDTGRSGKRLLWYYLSVYVSLNILVAVLQYHIAVFGSKAVRELPVIAVAVGCLSVISVWNICLLIWVCKRGEAGDNRYGTDPKAETAA